MLVKSFVSFALLFPYASAAIVSLYYPEDNGDGIPYMADPIGTDKSGHTTWRVALGTSSGTFTATQTSFSSITLVQGATDLQVFGEGLGLSESIECAYAQPTTSDGVVLASCAAMIADNSSALTTDMPSVTLTPVPFQVPADFKTSSAEIVRKSLSGIAVSALIVLSTAGVMLVRV